MIAWRVFRLAGGSWTWEPVAGWESIGLRLEWNQHGGVHRTYEAAEAAARRAFPEREER